jgi:hypothetical protein
MISVCFYGKYLAFLLDWTVGLALLQKMIIIL